VISVRAAVGDVSENLSIASYSLLNIGSTRLKTDANGNIPVITLDNFTFPEQRVDVLKIDIEGFERQSISETRNFLKKFHPKTIIIEIWEEATKTWMEDMFGLLGYRLAEPCQLNCLYHFDNQTVA
jgi:FkbM family methyltransferase